MRWQANESNAKWLWRHSTDQAMPFEAWQAQREAADCAAQARIEQRRAQAAAEKERAAWAYLHQSLAAAAAKFGTATLYRHRQNV